MRTMTIRNIPDELYERIKKSAASHRRSMNSEVLVCLEKGLLSTKLDVKAFLEEARALRAAMPQVLLTDEELYAAKNEGRP
ncbi:MAG: Arc family DNA-binding protein [Chloroflexi bacterium]|nr:Arc family DNA-binding protein [Chloroflexota bacterium]